MSCCRRRCCSSAHHAHQERHTFPAVPVSGIAAKISCAAAHQCIMHTKSATQFPLYQCPKLQDIFHELQSCRCERPDGTRLADVVAAEVNKHDVLRTLLLIRQQLRLQRRIVLRRPPPPPSPRQRPAPGCFHLHSFLPLCCATHFCLCLLVSCLG